MISALSFAADPLASIDPAVFERDLRQLDAFAAERGNEGIVVLIDDADALLEDVELTERLVESLDAAERWSAVLTCRPSGQHHLVEAVSPCLRRVRAVPLLPLITPDDVGVCLRAPLEQDDAERLLPTSREQELALQRDIANFTNGSPFEIAVLAQQLWYACRWGEQEVFKLTPRVLERTLRDLGAYSGIDESVEVGAAAARELPPDRIGAALELVAMTNLTPRQIAVVKALASPHAMDPVNGGLLSADLLEAERRVVEELEQLHAAGLLERTGEASFTVVGGRMAAPTLRHEARQQLGAGAPEVAFNRPYAERVAEPLAVELARHARQRLSGAQLRADMPVYTPTATASGARIRAAINAHTVSALEVPLLPPSEEALEALVAHLASDEALSIALVDLSMNAADIDLDYLELWALPEPHDQHDVLQALSDELDRWLPVVDKAGLTWLGSNVAVLSEMDARDALIAVVPDLARQAVLRSFRDWRESGDHTELDRALRVATDGAKVLREHPVPDWQRDFETSSMFSALGFLLSLYEDRQADARSALCEALTRGPGDGWVTHWNLANIDAHSGDFRVARQNFESLQFELEGWNSTAHVAIFVPNRPAAESLVVITSENAMPLLLPQLALVDLAAGEADENTLRETLADCAGSADECARAAAEWAADAIDAETEVRDATM